MVSSKHAPCAVIQAEQMRVTMNPADVALYAWLFPVVLQIVLPLLVLSGWLVLKLPLMLLSGHDAETAAKEIRVS